ncbi:hypothetical protein A3K80_08115 [Candidatus Bathyarchaeota archaeon RBG_13_38_9]|nr:MAG: hypothetical protein A3K80_08115 [Candidatus Bathyarchaeota archaeon RBG_13_38_9]
MSSRNLKKILLFGVLIWLIPFVVSFFIFPLRSSSRPLFESIMPVILTLAVAFFTVRYLSKISRDFVKEGILIGIVWLVTSLVIDLILFIPESPMQMTLSDYMVDIAITYLIILIIPVCSGYLMKKTCNN